MHSGTHIDALNHITCGADSHWFGDRREADDLGDFGSVSAEASSMPPFVCRGVLIDVPAHRKVEALEAGEAIGWEEVQDVASAQGVELRRGDAVLFRTGFMRAWGVDPELARRSDGAGIDAGVARGLADAGAVVVGGDTEGLEQLPSQDPLSPLPVHVELLIRRGVHIVELLHLEDLSRDEIYEFLFLCLPLRVRGATGSMVRPIAVI